MKEMRKLWLVIILVLLLIPSAAFSLSLPVAPIDFDIQDYTSLYYWDGSDWVPKASNAAPAVGDQSRAFLKIRNITDIVPDVTGPTDNMLWAYDSAPPAGNTEGLIAVEKDLLISSITTSGTETYLFFSGTTDRPNGTFEVYLSDPALDWYNEIALGDPNLWDALYATVSAAPATKWLAGEFTQSTYFGEFDDTNAGFETVTALVGIHLNSTFTEGWWINNNETVTMSSTINPQAWLNLDPLYSGPFIENYFGTGKDLAVGNVGLLSQGSYDWGSYSDDWIRGHTVPEPATLLLLGSGLLGAAFFGRRKNKKSS
jgi:hypothetical protein